MRSQDPTVSKVKGTVKATKIQNWRETWNPLLPDVPNVKRFMPSIDYKSFRMVRRKDMK
jgi:hypothetical protein